MLGCCCKGHDDDDDDDYDYDYDYDYVCWLWSWLQWWFIVMVKQGECEGIWDFDRHCWSENKCEVMLVVTGVLEGYPLHKRQVLVDMCIADVVPFVSMCLTSSNKPQLISLCRRILPRMGLIYFMWSVASLGRKKAFKHCLQHLFLRNM